MDEKMSGLGPIITGIVAICAILLLLFGTIQANLMREISQTETLLRERTGYLGEAEDKIEELQNRIRVLEAN